MTESQTPELRTTPMTPPRSPCCAAGSVRNGPHVYRRRARRTGLHPWCSKWSTTASTKPGRSLRPLIVTCTTMVLFGVRQRPGIPTDIHKEEGVSAAEVIMTVLHAGGKFDTTATRFPAACTALASRGQRLVLAPVAGYLRDGNHHRQEYAGGEPLYPLKLIGPSSKRAPNYASCQRGNLHRRPVPLRHPGQAPA